MRETLLRGQAQLMVVPQNLVEEIERVARDVFLVFGVDVVQPWAAFVAGRGPVPINK